MLAWWLALLPLQKVSSLNSSMGLCDQCACCPYGCMHFVQVLWLPLTVQKHVCHINWSLEGYTAGKNGLNQILYPIC